MSNVILFDLDGTLTDSAEGITKCVQYALQHFGIEEPDLKKLECFIGPPLKEQFMKYARLSKSQAEVAVSVYRERYSRTGIFENQLYGGVSEMLQYLKKSGKTLGVASSKPTIYVNQILEHFEIRDLFDVVVGSELDGSRSDKAAVIEEALALLGMSGHRAEVLMVGDRRHDVEGALECGLQCIGVTYGFGTSAELQSAGAVYLVQSVEDLKVLARRTDNRMREELLRGRRETAAVRQYSESAGKKIWRVVYPIGIHYGISLTVAQIGAMLIMAWAGITMGITDSNELYSYVSKNSLAMTGVSAIIAIPILSWFYKKDCILRKNGFLGDRKNNRKYITKGIYAATIISMITLSQILNDLITISGLYQIFPSYSELNQAVFQDQPLLLTILVVVICAPIVEELVFRGLVFKRIQDYLGTGWGILISALAFGIYHGNMIQFIYAGLLGGALAVVMAKTNSIKLAAIAHLAANLWSVLGSGVLNYLSGGNRYLYMGYLVVFVLLCVLSMVYIINANKKGSQLQGIADNAENK